MPARAEELERELGAMSQRICRDIAHKVRGVVQLTGSDESGARFHLVEANGVVQVQRGAHPRPDVQVTAPMRVFLNMFRGRFAFFDPDALSHLRIDGDVERLLPLFSYVADSDQKLEPFEMAARVRASAPRLSSIARLECPTENVLREAMAEYRPLLITGAVQQWPWMAKTLTPDSMAAGFGDERLTSEGRHGETQAETIASFLHRCRAGAVAATAGLTPKVLRDAAGYPGYFQPQDYRWPFFFMGANGAVSPIHRDLAHNLAVHVFGEKRWRLFSPDDAECLYPNMRPDDGPSAQTCLVDVDAPDLERFPLYAQARPLEVLVKPGEILFVPSGWFHHVTALTLCLNLAYSLKWGKGRPGELKVDRTLIDLTAGEDAI